ncbi:GNAT family N-acetyltransferase [Streptacidiphilus monticola]|jgi:RimJ/RimL family protein N-acetyltransferase|uniref:GNAT family N-acetyltransferase n=1 Tax=Streptacidiphilus monticola TaxID=2161674 RepID=A0ABW1G4J6_9ACTN
MAAKTPAPVLLQGRHVRLEPLTLDHVPGLHAALGADEEVFRWLGPVPRTEQELRDLAAGLLADPGYVAFAVVLQQSGQPVGWTTFLDMAPQDERLEIGWTWYARAHWRSAVNTEAKLLLLTHAFEDLGMGRVQLKTDHLNTRSQQAIARLGATREGVLRRHRRRADGSWRDSVYFSLLAEEWPAAKARLTERLERG